MKPRRHFEGLGPFEGLRPRFLKTGHRGTSCSLNRMCSKPHVLEPLTRSWVSRFMGCLSKVVADSERWLLWQQCVVLPGCPDAKPPTGALMEQLLDRLQPLPLQELDPRLRALLVLDAPWPQVLFWGCRLVCIVLGV